MTKQRPPVINYAESLSISGKDGDYAGYIDCVQQHGVWWISRLLVKPEYRPRGYALLLGREAIRRWGHRELWVHVSAYQDQPLSDAQLMILYRRAGFQPTDVPGILRRPPTEK